MKGDFGRLTFDATRHMRRVLSQQGRVEVDADKNEQTAIILHYLEAMMTDLIGPYAAPIPPASSTFDNFRIVKGDDATFNFGIDPGHYWVDGVLCENDAIEPVLFTEQPDVPQDDPPDAGNYLAYLDVWERHLCADEDPSLREVALGGPDTASRARLVWQVKLDLLDNVPKPQTLHDEWPDWVARWQPPNRGLLTAEARMPTDATDPCVTPPDSRYRGLENQLYRVEVHTPGTAGAATFTWSRDNGSIVYPIRWLRGATGTRRSSLAGPALHTEAGRLGGGRRRPCRATRHSRSARAGRTRSTTTSSRSRSTPRRARVTSRGTPRIPCSGAGTTMAKPVTS